jgi:UDP-N-acetyl-D-galactosamine dehydrogenase
LQEYGINLIPRIEKKYDGILLAVSHNEFVTLQLSDLKKDSNTPVFDLKGFLPRNEVNSRL